MRRAPALSLAAACVAATVVLAGCPSPWAKYGYEKAPRTAERISAGEFVPSSGEAISVDISADREWQDTELDLKPGDAVQIVAEGMWNPDVAAGDRDCSAGGYRNPSGYYVPEVRSLRYGALIGRIGDGAPVLVGESSFIAALADGRLRMACNRTLQSAVLGRGELSVKIYLGRTRSSIMESGG